MPKKPDDPLADAALTPEQRAAWQKYQEDHLRLQSKISELQSRLEVNEDEPPTGMILSRPEFNREVARLLALEERYGGTSSLVYFEAENLDQLTDKHGRNVGNAAIRKLCDTLLAHVRACDIVGRLDKHEFGVLLVRCDLENAWRKGALLAEQMRGAVAEVHTHTFDLSVSYGAYTFGERDDVANGVKSAAKAMLEESKKI
ncbi:MAG: GGDEF domain-containing protein [Alphaproteobacteria bacterium]